MTIIPGHERPDSPEQPAGAGFHGAAIAADPPGSGGAWRALDASANRAAEALRVIEDVLRFVLDDAHLTAVAKRLRHDLGDLLATQPLPERIRLRDVAGDVGPGVGPVGALPRRSPADLVAANGARAAQALRSLQEWALLLQPLLAPRFEALRYRLYDLERAALVLARASERAKSEPAVQATAGISSMMARHFESRASRSRSPIGPTVCTTWRARRRTSSAPMTRLSPRATSSARGRRGRRARR